jgi:hypothetical protein
MKIILSLICMLGLYQSAFAITLRSAYSDNLCLDVNQGDPNSWRYKTNVEVWPCHGLNNQQFNLKPVYLAGDRKTFTIQALGQCMDVDMGYLDSWTHKTNIQLYACNGGDNQKFRVEPQDSGWFIIRSLADGRCLDIDLNTADGWRYERNVQLWNCTGESNQLWKLSLDSHDNDDIIIIPTN